MDGLLVKAQNERIPLIGNFELTRKCPLNCVICYNERKTTRPEMTLKEIKNIIDELASMGCMHLNLTGGDPLIHKNFVEIYSYVLSKGIIPSVESSLVHLTDEVIEIFNSYRPETLAVSFYGYSRDTYSAATQSSVNPQLVRENIIKLTNNGIKIKLRTPVTKINIHEIGYINDFAKKYNILYRPTVKIFWKQSGERCDEYRCSIEDIEKYIHINSIYKTLYKEAKRLYESNIRKSDCSTGITDFNVNAYCELNFCITFWKPLYDLRKGSFKDAWDNWYPLFRRMENNYCIGKKLFRKDDYCPWGDLYTNKEINTCLSLEEHLVNRIENDLSCGVTKEEIIRNLNLSHKMVDKYFDNK